MGKVKMSRKVSILNKDGKSPGRLSGKGLSLLYTEGDGRTAGQERMPGMCRGREGPMAPRGSLPGMPILPVHALLPTVGYIGFPPTPGDGLALLGMLSSSAA